MLETDTFKLKHLPFYNNWQLCEHILFFKSTPREYNTRICASWKLYALCGINSAHAGIKGGWPVGLSQLFTEKPLLYYLIILCSLAYYSYSTTNYSQINFNFNSCCIATLMRFLYSLVEHCFADDQRTN